jgi:hypothetical protein
VLSTVTMVVERTVRLCYERGEAACLARKFGPYYERTLESLMCGKDFVRTTGRNLWLAGLSVVPLVHFSFDDENTDNSQRE